MKHKLAVICLFLSSFIAGCSYISIPSLPWSSPASQSNPTAEALFEEGMTHFNNKKYGTAIDRFQRVKVDFPFSPQVLSAELKLAEAYYLNKQYQEAAAAFKEFHTLHPTNENIPFVIYHLGLAHFDQFTDVDREQKKTEIARGYFETVVKNYPGSPYASKAKEKLAKCLEYLAEHEFNIGAFYMRGEKYPAARDRFEEILRRYRDTPTAVKTLYHLGESYRLEKNSVKATLAYEALIQHYPESPLAKEARTQLGHLEKEKQDPLAMLLMRDRRPIYAPPPIPESSQQKQQKELNLVAKKEVVHEEPGDEKGIFRRVLDTLNPFASSSGKKENGNKKIETALSAKAQADKEESESNGFFGSLWRGLNPFAKEEKKKVELAQDPRLVGRIDESLRQRGIATGAQHPVTRPPAPDLPQAEEPTPPPVDRAELLGKIDSNLKKQGKDVAELPPPPEADPALRASSNKGTKQPASKAETSASASGLISNIDQRLKTKGIEPPKASLPSSTRPASEPGAESRSKRQELQEKVELETRLTTEKRPFFLDPGGYRVPEADKPSEEKGKAETKKPTESLKELPQAVVRSPAPPQAVAKPSEAKPAEKKKAAEGEEESKGVLEQFKEDLGRLKDLLNPFSW